MPILLLLLLLFFINCLSQKQDEFQYQANSPYNQKLPNCDDKKYDIIQKKTNTKAILCPMFKDEEGFLSEWVGYYQMHGFDHIMMFDDNSTDDSLVELKPWIDNGFVTIVQNWTDETTQINPRIKQEFKKKMATKALLESQCKLYALQHGFDLTISLDIDEYIVPRAPKVSIVDELMNWFNKTSRSVYCIDKLNFQSTPHILEPINLLTIEAFHTRMKQPRKMNYYTTVQPKCAYRLSYFSGHSNVTQEYIAKCCHFHGCEKHDYVKDSKFCGQTEKSEGPRLNGKGKPWYEAFDIYHYSRSIEKYAIKSKTWTTATGEVSAGQTGLEAAKSYDIPKFLQRSVGWYYDDKATKYGCQLRDVMRTMTKEEKYLRPGFGWYRNPEFAKYINDPDKRGRYGRPNPEGFKFEDGNMLNYHGKGYSGQSK